MSESRWGENGHMSAGKGGGGLDGIDAPSRTVLGWHVCCAQRFFNFLSRFFFPATSERFRALTWRKKEKENGQSIGCSTARSKHTFQIKTNSRVGEKQVGEKETCYLLDLKRIPKKSCEVFSKFDDGYRYRTGGSSRIALRYERVPYQSSIRGVLWDFFCSVCCNSFRIVVMFYCERDLNYFRVSINLLSSAAMRSWEVILDV